MCMTPESERQFSYLDVADPVYSSDKDVVARQFSDVMSYAGSDSFDDYVAKLDLAPQVSKTTTLNPVAWASPPPITIGSTNTNQQAPKQGFYTHSNLPEGYKNPAPYNPSMPLAQHGQKTLYATAGGPVAGRIPVYADVTNSRYSPQGDFYSRVQGLGADQRTNLQTDFIQDLRGGNISDVLRQYGVGDIIGQSRAVRGVGKANIGDDYSTTPMVHAGPSSSVSPKGKAQAGRLNLPEPLFRSSINNSSVRNVS